MKFALISATCILVLVSLLPSSFATSQNSTLDNQGNYTNPSLGISFHVPEGWLVQEPKKSQSGAPDIAIVGPYSAGFTPSISFSVENANGTTLDDYMKKINDQLTYAQQSGNIKLLSEKQGTIAGHASKIILIQENFTSGGKNMTLKFKQLNTLVNDQFYTITYASDINTFESGLAVYDKLIETIKFANSGQSLNLDYISIIVIAVLIGIVIMMIKRKKYSPVNNKK